MSISSSDASDKKCAATQSVSPGAIAMFHTALVVRCEAVFKVADKKWNGSSVEKEYLHIHTLREGLSGASGGVSHGLAHTKYRFAILYLYAKELELVPSKRLGAASFMNASGLCLRLNTKCVRDDYAKQFSDKAEEEGFSHKERSWPPEALKDDWLKVWFFLHINRWIAKILDCTSYESFKLER